MNGKILPQFAVCVPDNSCKLALIEPFLINHWRLNSQSLCFVQRLGSRVDGDTETKF